MPTEDRGTTAPAEAPLSAALLLFGAILVFISSCGGQGLMFPGNMTATPTPQFTATPTP